MDNLFFSLSICLELLTIIITILVFFRGRLRLSGMRSFFFLSVLFAVTTFSYFLLQNIFGNGESFQVCFSVATLAAITVVLSWLFQENLFVTAFVVFAARNYMDGVNLSSELVSHFFWMTVGSHHEMAVSFFCRLLVYIIFVPMLYQIFKNYIGPSIEVTKSLDIWKYLWMVPVSFCLTYQLMIAPLLRKGHDRLGGVFVLFSLAWLFGVFFCLMALFKLLSESLKNVLLTEKLHTAELLTEMEKKQYSLLQNNIDETRKARHDLRHHLLALRGYAKLQDTDGCIRYIDQFLSQGDSYQMRSYCSNYVVDSIISYYAQRAQDLQIPMETEIQLPTVLPIQEVDFCTILGNLLSNALEAIERQTEGDRFIHLSMGITGSLLAVSVINSYSGEIREKDGVFLSSHHENEGIGTMSIRHIARKYQGIVKFQYEGGIFDASLLLKTD